jgi:hypothetical protein
MTIFKSLSVDVINYKLLQIAGAFDKAKRVGYGKKDKPEGTLTIILSDTLAKQISKEIKDIVKCLKDYKQKG